MKTMRLVFIASAFFFAAWGAFAQEFEMGNQALYLRSPSRAWLETVDELKESTGRLLKENDLLNRENSLLGEEILRLQQSIEEAKKENQRLLSEPPRLNKLIRETETYRQSLEKEISSQENQANISEKERSVLKLQLSDADNKFKAVEDQRNALSKEKERLLAELRDSQASKNTDGKVGQANIDQMKQQLSAGDQKIKETNEAIDQASKLYTKILEDINRLQKENRESTSALSKTKGTLKGHQQELEALKSQNKNFDQVLQKDLAAKADEKAKWQNSINQLQAQAEEIRKNLATASSEEPIVKVDDKLAQIENLKKQNQGHADEIAHLTEGIAKLKKENAMIEELLSAQKQALLTQSTEEASQQPSEELGPEGASALEALAFAYATQGQYDKAIDKYEQALKENGNIKNIYFNLGYLHYKIGNLTQAINYYKRVVQIDPNDEEAKGNINALKQKLSGSKE